MRILLAAADVPFVDERLTFPAGMKPLKHEVMGNDSPLLFDQLPMVVSPDGTSVVQTAACMQFIGRSVGLAPADCEMDARALALTLGSEVSWRAPLLPPVSPVIVVTVLMPSFPYCHYVVCRLSCRVMMITSMVMSMVAPGFIGRAPGPVPQAMRSPGCNVTKCESFETISAGWRNRSVSG